MLGKTSKPSIEILTGSFVSGSTTIPAESNIQSPRGLKCFDLGGVGLGIVAALEKSGGDRVAALFGRNVARSSAIPVKLPKNCWRIREEEEQTEMEMELDCLEECKIVTCRGSDAAAEGGRKVDRVAFGMKSCRKSNRATVFHISPAIHGEATGVPATDFLSSCNLCNKKLHGRDIYMYRGEKAFCSSECRYRQMVMDERKEKCGAQVSPAVEVAGSPYGNGQMFAAGILAT